LAQRTLASTRIHPALRCVCGRVLTVHELDLDENHIRLSCARCHTRLIEIPVFVIDGQGERW
jgi:hypothetical protein